MSDAQSVTRLNRVVGIAGSYGGLNVGDEAILTVAISALRTALPGVEVVAFSRNVAHTREHHDVDRVVPAREAMRAQVKSEVQRLDLLLLGGGGILYDREAESYLQLARVAQQMGVPTATYAIGAGPLERNSERQAVVEVLNRMRFVTVRDLDAKLLLERIGVERPIAVTADPALLLQALPFPGRWLEREGIGNKTSCVNPQAEMLFPGALAPRPRRARLAAPTRCVRRRSGERQPVGCVNVQRLSAGATCCRPAALRVMWRYRLAERVRAVKSRRYAARCARP
ncbi:MAG: polysaccharide pyruvyl transferase family protein [Solirubrobacteraceae bacterium]